MTVTTLSIKNKILSNARALGNSKRGLKEVCSDLVNSYGASSKQLKQLSAGTFLSTTTLDRMAKLNDTDSGTPYRPNADTCERILRFFNTEIYFNEVVISARYANKPKDDLIDV